MVIKLCIEADSVTTAGNYNSETEISLLFFIPFVKLVTMVVTMKELERNMRKRFDEHNDTA